MLPNILQSFETISVELKIFCEGSLMLADSEKQTFNVINFIEKFTVMMIKSIAELISSVDFPWICFFYLFDPFLQNFNTKNDNLKLSWHF